MLPSFFLAGVPKAGTTSMYRYLEQHPEIFMSRPKEPHFFSWKDDGWPRWAVKDRNAYEMLFARARPDQERGEASTWTLFSEAAPRRIAEAISDPRFIVMLRNPVDRAFSNWTFNFGKGYEPIDSFEEALAAEPERLAGGEAWHFGYLEAGKYHGQLQRYIDLFGRDRVLVLLFEDFKADPAAAVRTAYAFLGVDPAFEADTTTAHNSTTFPRFRWLQEVTSGRSRAKDVLKAVVPDGLGTRIARRVHARNTQAPPTLHPETRKRLQRFFRDDIERLSSLLDRDLCAFWLS